ncbi:hypothetical protein J2W42_002461 [Rhizobium tibeticum]|uniref:Uncharacterized conserved protein n=1 Tax=Rhizobium tibeticum TaxID=501024 RepID=A0A1H8SMW9_9HYPH|nr:GFA family protein [Rhizobium tibeticum]MDP9809609.1 hypothetical protein [Rhizobium tibeticum]SEI12629.1 hypothetical protein RTCCBAU85039_4832 [Rhizobium tibeticum]SEO80309.1 Uncharacterized conserved protein [Rhizobium tibeticum]
MSDAKTRHTGGCGCGAIRYRIDEAPLCSGICHCHTCRKVASAPTLPFVTFPVRTLVYEQGAPRAFASSKGVVRTFCGSCGSPLGYQNDADPGLIDIMTVSLDEPDEYHPTFHVWTSEKVSWDVICDDLPAHPKSRT